MFGANKWISAVLVFSVGFASYLSSLDGGFVFDDHRAILTNDDLDTEKTSIFGLLQNDFWGGSMTRTESHKSYRPLTVLTYRYLNHYFYKLEPYSYHLVNVILHCAASVLFLFVCQFFLSCGAKPPQSLYHSLVSDRWPVIAALLFTVHSVHTEAVASVVGRAEVLSCIFFLLSLLSYLKAIKESELQTRWRLVILCIILSGCSMLSKEQGVTVLAVCAGYDVLINWVPLWKFICEICAKKRKRKISGETDVIVNAHVQLTEVTTVEVVENEPSESALFVSIVIRRIGILAVTGVLLLWFRLAMNHNSEPIFKPYELRAAYHENRSVRALSFSNIYSINAWLLLSPSSLCCDWSLGSVPLVTSITDPRNIPSLLLYITILLLAVHTIRSNRDRLLVGMGLMLLLLPFIPASGLVFRVGFVVAERILYMPSLGSCFLVTLGARRLAATNHKMMRYLVYVSLLVLIVTMGVKTHERNKEWATDFDLFESGVRVLPTNVKLRNNYGMELKEKGRTSEAKKQYQAAIKIDPEYGEVYFNYGNLLSDEGNFAEAAESFEKAIVYPQMYSRTLNNLATMYFRLGRYKEAEKRFLESLKLAPDQASTYNNLASLYGESKRYQESEEMFRKALEMSPTYVEAMFNLGTLYVQMGRYEDGERELQRALQLNPQHHGAINNLKVAQHYRDKKRRK